MSPQAIIGGERRSERVVGIVIVVRHGPQVSDHDRRSDRDRPGPPSDAFAVGVAPPAVSVAERSARSSSLTSVTALTPPVRGDDWVALSDGPLPVGTATDWAVLASCGAVVVFSGTSRDHAGDRSGITALEYEAYDAHVVPRLSAIVASARRTWPDLGRVALLHRLGTVPVGASSVVVVASAPHRDTAFAAARFGIDTLKSTVPIWKREEWPGGSEWVLDHPIAEVPPTATAAASVAGPVDVAEGVRS